MALLKIRISNLWELIIYKIAVLYNLLFQFCKSYFGEKFISYISFQKTNRRINDTENIVETSENQISIARIGN